MHGHKPRKRFGQHFLRDLSVVEKLMSAIRPKADDHLVEIGPGFGVLTQALLAGGPRVTAIELDRDLARHLQAHLRAPALTLLVEDVLRVDFGELSDNTTALRVVGNLPYNISSPLLFHLIKQLGLIEDMHFMLQAEFVERLVAAPGSKSYGRLSVMTQIACEPELLFYVEPEAFSPAPRVRSAVARIIPRKKPLVGHDEQVCFDEIVRTAFTKRRKTLRNALKTLLTVERIESAGIDPGRRPETLSIAEFAALGRQLTRPEN